MTACRAIARRGVSRGEKESKDYRECQEMGMPIGSKFVVTNCSVAYLIVHKSISIKTAVIFNTLLRGVTMPVGISWRAILLGGVPYRGASGYTS